MRHSTGVTSIHRGSKLINFVWGIKGGTLWLGPHIYGTDPDMSKNFKPIVKERRPDCVMWWDPSICVSVMYRSLKQSDPPLPSGGTTLPYSVVKMSAVRTMGSAVMGCGEPTVHACPVLQAAGEPSFGYLRSFVFYCQNPRYTNIFFLKLAKRRQHETYLQTVFLVGETLTQVHKWRNIFFSWGSLNW